MMGVLYIPTLAKTSKTKNHWHFEVVGAPEERVKTEKSSGFLRKLT